MSSAVMGATTPVDDACGPSQAISSPPPMRAYASGPFVVALRFEGTMLAGEGQTLNTVVAMTFPNSKSWAEVVMTVEDQGGALAGLAADLAL